jgi:hypothetical protein
MDTNGPGRVKGVSWTGTSNPYRTIAIGAAIAFSGLLASQPCPRRPNRRRSRYRFFPQKRHAIEKFLALGPVSRILFHALRRFGRHFSRALAGPPVRPRGANPAQADRCDIPETMGRAVQSPILSCTGRGFSCHPPRGGRGGLLPHLFTLTLRPFRAAWRYVLCDTVRRRGLNRAACACLSARAASCPAVSGLSSPNFYRARRYPRLGIKELGATTWPQS